MDRGMRPAHFTEAMRVYRARYSHVLGTLLATGRSSDISCRLAGSKSSLIPPNVRSNFVVPSLSGHLCYSPAAFSAQASYRHGRLSLIPPIHSEH